MGPPDALLRPGAGSLSADRPRVSNAVRGAMMLQEMQLVYADDAQCVGVVAHFDVEALPQMGPRVAVAVLHIRVPAETA
jgi:hypothetical protein